MNYFTFKKAVAYSMVFALGLTAANAQDTPTSSSTAKIFGGRGQYRTWSVGVNAGVLSPVAVIGGSNDFTNWDVNLGYGLTVRKQFGHAFGLELSGLRGTLAGDNSDAVGGVANNTRAFETDLSYAVSLMGVANVASVDFLRRENAVSFLVKAGYGVMGFAPDVTLGDGTHYDFKNQNSDGNHRIKEQYFPVGAGAKFKLSDRVNFDLGYNIYFVDGDLVDGTYAKGFTKDKYSYGYAGVEFSLGSAAKPNLDWVNPVALMYDELKDPTLRQELEALKGRVSTLEGTVNQLSADADGDGVSDKFDKCPGTPAGTVVDGSGCPIKFPEPAPAAASAYPATGSIMFEFDSSVLKTSSYAALDQEAAYLKANTAVTIKLDGYASAEGTESYNVNLSKDRANAVKTYLVNAGVDAARITATGYGEKNPVASNSTEEGRIQNRRVEFK